MKTVLTVVGNPADNRPAEFADEIAGALGTASGTSPGPATWLAPGVAFDLPFSGLSLGAAEACVHALNHPVDVLAQAATGRRKRLLVADMDATMITVECIDELADFAGLKAEIAAITTRAMRGELDFEAALKARVAKLKGLGEAALKRCYEERIRYTPGASVLVQTMAANGAYCALVSGGFTVFASRVAAQLGFHEHRANRLTVADGELKGTVEPPIIGAATKLAVLRELTASLGLAVEDTMAVGDGANDLPMIEAAGLGVAFHAKPKVAAAARARVDHSDLATLLYFQGYTEADFVAE